MKLRLSKILSRDKALKLAIVSNKKVSDLDSDDTSEADYIYDIYFASKNTKFWVTSYNISMENEDDKPYLNFYKILNGKQVVNKIVDLNAHHQDSDLISIEDPINNVRLIKEFNQAPKSDLFLMNGYNSYQPIKINKFLAKK